jgi:hypothetical protein
MTDALTAAIDTFSYDAAALSRLLDLLAATDADGDEATAVAALARIGGRPRLLRRLDEGLRVAGRWDERQLPLAYRTFRTRFDRGSREPIVVALISLDRNGRLREQALRTLVELSRPELTSFLVLRATDWVGQIREPALTELARVLAEEPARYLPRAVPMTVELAGRYHGRRVHDLVTAAVLTAPDDLRRRLAISPDRHQRRLAFDADLSQHRLDLDALTGLAVRESDALIRHRAAQLAYEQAVAGGHRAVLRRLGTARSADARALGCTGLLRLGCGQEVVAALNDPAPLVRAIAREAARRVGLDVVAHYRTAEPSPGSVAGLAEAGSDRDAPVLVALLEHSSGAVRAAAVRALGRLGSVPVELVLPLLRDPAPAVVREAAVVLSPFERRVPAELKWELLGDDRPELRRAGYRLLGGRDLATRFRAALWLAGDADARWARRGRLDALRLAHLSPGERWDYEAPGPVIETMRALVQTHRATLGPAADRLAELLTPPRPAGSAAPGPA